MNDVGMDDRRTSCGWLKNGDEDSCSNFGVGLTTDVFLLGYRLFYL